MLGPNHSPYPSFRCSRAPPHILNVNPGQPVELRVAKRLNESFVRQPKSTQSNAGGSSSAFTGTGNRLGAVVPEVTAGGGSTSMPGGFPGGSANTSSAPRESTATGQTRFEVDQTQPMTSVQIRLADGTRCGFNRFGGFKG